MTFKITNENGATRIPKASKDGIIVAIFLAFLATAGLFYVNLGGAFLSAFVDGLGISRESAGYITSANKYGAAFLIGPFVSPIQAFEIQWPLFLGHGAFIGVASCLLALGPRYIGSTEVSLLILLESILAPILVWFVIGESPGFWALVGGAVVVGSLLFSNLYLLAKQKSL